MVPNALVGNRFLYFTTTSRDQPRAVYTEMGAAHKAEAQWRQIVAEVPGYRYAWQCLGDNLLAQEKLAEAAPGIPWAYRS